MLCGREKIKIILNEDEAPAFYHLAYFSANLTPRPFSLPYHYSHFIFIQPLMVFHFILVLPEFKVNNYF